MRADPPEERDLEILLKLEKYLIISVIGCDSCSAQMIQGAVAPTENSSLVGGPWVGLARQQPPPGRSGQVEVSQQWREAGGQLSPALSPFAGHRGHFIRLFTSNRPGWLGCPNPAGQQRQLTSSPNMEFLSLADIPKE